MTKRSVPSPPPLALVPDDVPPDTTVEQTARSDAAASIEQERAAHWSPLNAMLVTESELDALERTFVFATNRLGRKR